MTRKDHREGENFKKNHENTGQKPSKIDRDRFRKERENYWKREYKKHKPPKPKVPKNPDSGMTNSPTGNLKEQGGPN
jgi:hypothetical protein